MSLIHEALKKAEKKVDERVHLPATTRIFDVRRMRYLNKRTIVLGAVFVCVLVIGLIVHLAGRPSKPAQPSANGVANNVANLQMKRAEADRLKKSAEVAYISGDLDRAWVGFSAAHQISKKDPEILNNLGVISKRRGNVALAKQYYESALALRPEYAEVLNNMAMLDMMEDKYADAEKKLTDALNICSNCAEANFNMALCKERSGDKKGAILYYMNFLRNVKEEKPIFLEEVRKHVLSIQE
jgi:Tfp pilus assembly protein PilF